jgi:uncharacterized membrane protein YkvA (DUF1232 family)
MMSPLSTILCVLYVLSPIDFIPDFLAGVGWIDDMGVLAYLGYHLFLSQEPKRK